MLAVDGGTYCLPADAHINTRPDLLRFADPACSQRVIPTRHTWAIFAAADSSRPGGGGGPGGRPGAQRHRVRPGQRWMQEKTSRAPGTRFSPAEVAPLDQFVRLVATP